MVAARVAFLVVVAMTWMTTAIAPGTGEFVYASDGPGWVVVHLVLQPGVLNAVLEGNGLRTSYIGLHFLDEEGRYLRGPGFAGRNEATRTTVEASKGSEFSQSVGIGRNASTVPARIVTQWGSPPPSLYVLAWGGGVESFNLRLSSDGLAVDKLSEGDGAWIVMDEELEGDATLDARASLVGAHIIHNGSFSFNVEHTLVGTVGPGISSLPMSTVTRSIEGPDGLMTCPPCIFRSLDASAPGPGSYTLIQDGATTEPNELGIAFAGVDAHLPP